MNASQVTERNVALPESDADRQQLLDELESLSPPELLRWAYENYGDRAAIITSFQDTGCVMIDMAYTAGVPLRVCTVDSLRLHPETYELMDQIEARYDAAVERFQPDPERVKRMVEQHGEYLFFDSKAKQEFCCNVRKVEPNVEALNTVDVWITGLRRDHSGARSATPQAQFIEAVSGDKLKLAPLANWSTEDVWQYIEKLSVPYNPLYKQGYTSIGCVICSTPTLPHEDKRAGRWRWFNSMKADDDKECGIHTMGSGI